MIANDPKQKKLSFGTNLSLITKDLSTGKNLLAIKLKFYKFSYLNLVHN